MKNLVWSVFKFVQQTRNADNILRKKLLLKLSGVDL